RNLHGDFLHQALEIWALGGKIGLTIHFHQHSQFSARMNVGTDRAFRGDATGALGRRGDALLAQPERGFFQISTALGERLLAIHHPSAGLLAQILNHFRVYFHPENVLSRSSHFPHPPARPARGSAQRIIMHRANQTALGDSAGPLPAPPPLPSGPPSSWPFWRSSASCLPSSTASAIAAVNSLIARFASSLPGMRCCMSSGWHLVLRTVVTVMPSRFASATAISSFLVSITHSASGSLRMFLIPARVAISLPCSRSFSLISFLVSARIISGSAMISSSFLSRSIDARMVWKLVSMPPSQRLFT